MLNGNPTEIRLVGCQATRYNYSVTYKQSKIRTSHKHMRRYGSFSTVTGWGTGTGIRFPSRVVIFRFTTADSPTGRSRQPPIQRVTGLRPQGTTAGTRRCPWSLPSIWSTAESKRAWTFILTALRVLMASCINIKTTYLSILFSWVQNISLSPNDVTAQNNINIFTAVRTSNRNVAFLLANLRCTKRWYFA